MDEDFKDIAISSRIRLARNVSGFNFFTKLTSEQDAKFIVSSVSNALKNFADFDIITLKNLSLNECNSLLERHIISKELIDNKDISAVALSPDEHFIVMMNEEDHIREQCIYKGFNLYKPYREIKRLDEQLLSEVDVAYNNKFGFLTASPSNLGTGMRASVMLFLPALKRAGEMENLKADARAHGFTVRGLYGEGSGAAGSFYQISNQNSLGQTEEEIVDSVSDFVFQICQSELSAREDILSSDHSALVDEIFRAYGVLKECFCLQEAEMIEMLSLVRFGQALGVLKISDQKAFENLFVEGAGANLMEIENFSSKNKEVRVRSDYINKKITELVSKV